MRSVLKTVLVLSIFWGVLNAKEVKLPQCDNKSICVNDKNFYVEVKRVVRRGDVVIVQLSFIGKASYQYHFKFAYNSSEGYAAILDAQGNEFKIPGKKISNFYLSEGEEKVLSLKFRGDKQNKIVEPFDLTLKTRSDEVTLFDLKSG